MKRRKRYQARFVFIEYLLNGGGEGGVDYPYIWSSALLIVINNSVSDILKKITITNLLIYHSCKYK